MKNNWGYFYRYIETENEMVIYLLQIQSATLIQSLSGIYIERNLQAAFKDVKNIYFSYFWHLKDYDLSQKREPNAVLGKFIQNGKKKESLIYLRQEMQLFFSKAIRCSTLRLWVRYLIYFEFIYVDVSDGLFIWTAKWAWAGKWLNGSRHNPHFQQQQKSVYVSWESPPKPRSRL